MPDLALNKAVAAELDELRLQTRRTFEEIAEGSGISVPTAKRYLHGQRPIPVDALGAIAWYLGDDPIAVFARAAARVQREN